MSTQNFAVKTVATLAREPRETISINIADFGLPKTNGRVDYDMWFVLISPTPEAGPDEQTHLAFVVGGSQFCDTVSLRHSFFKALHRLGIPCDNVFIQFITIGTTEYPINPNY
jgi:hypothetical protein